MNAQVPARPRAAERELAELAQTTPRDQDFVHRASALWEAQPKTTP